MVVKINELVKANESSRLKGVIVFLAPKEKKEAIETMAKDHGIVLPMVLPLDLDQTMKLYQINPDARNTVLVTDRNKVLFNRADVSDETFDKVSEAVTGMIKN